MSRRRRLGADGALRTEERLEIAESKNRKARKLDETRLLPHANHPLRSLPSTKAPTSTLVGTVACTSTNVSSGSPGSLGPLSAEQNY